MLLYLLAVSLISYTDTANILCTVAIPGSHFFLTQQIAELLANHGHNVTFLSATNETRVKMDPRIKYVTPKQGGYADLEDYFALMDQIISGEVIDLPSETMGLDWINHSNEAAQLYIEQQFELNDYLTGPEVQDLLESGEFDVIVAEETAMIPILAAAYNTDIPVVAINSISDVGMVIRDRLNMPWMLSSEPFFHFWQPAIYAPTFKERLTAVQRMFSIALMFTKLTFYDFQIKYFDPVGVQDIRYLYKNLQIFLMNDHPAISFPYFTPANTLYIGDIHFKGSYQIKPLPSLYLDFIDNCKNSHIIYVSFGTYLRDVGKISWINDFLGYLETLDACIIFKATAGIAPNTLPDHKFLVVPWVPQKDLLGSNKVSYFLSHCGNNGRLESILYKVPLLCIPMFADQLTNAMMVQRNGFGLVLLKEELSRETLQSRTEQMVKNREMFVEKMERAVEIINSEPWSGKDNILFYVNQLAQHGTLDHLQNKIILEQSIFEIYNLDLLAVGAGIVLVATFLLCRLLGKLRNY